jgi:TPR repeat protein
MASQLVRAGLLSLAVLLAGCDGPTPPKAAQKSAESDKPTKKGPGLIELARQGDAGAQRQLEFNLKVLEELAEKGEGKDQFGIGNIYSDGEIVPKDLRKAAEWYQKAAAQGHATSQAILGMNYVTGQGGVVRDVAKGIEWLEKAAAQREGDAQFFLGNMYRNGENVAKDPVRPCCGCKRRRHRTMHQPSVCLVGCI